MRLSRRPDDPEQVLGRVDFGKMMVMIDRHDYWQCAYVIRKGGFDAIRSAGIDAFRAEIAALVPWVADRVNELRAWDDVKLLTVSVDRLRTWYRPGLLCIGDAAHAMSPIGGVGINLAVQDAVAAANILYPAFRLGAPGDGRSARGAAPARLSHAGHSRHPGRGPKRLHGQNSREQARREDECAARAAAVRVDPALAAAAGLYRRHRPAARTHPHARNARLTRGRHPEPPKAAHVKNRWHRFIAALGIAALLSTPFASVPARAAEPYTIDVILSLTGAFAFLGTAEGESLKTLEVLINKEGGINGQPVHFNLLDDQTQPAVAVQLANGIIAKHPPVMLGPTFLASCLAIAPLMKQRAGGLLLRADDPSGSRQLRLLGRRFELRSSDRDARLREGKGLEASRGGHDQRRHRTRHRRAVQSGYQGSALQPA